MIIAFIQAMVCFILMTVAWFANVVNYEILFGFLFIGGLMNLFRELDKKE